MKLKIKNTEIQEILSGEPTFVYPKYTTQLMNLANSNSQATRAKNVGQLSDLIQEFGGETLTEWESFYKKRFPNAIKEASVKIYNMTLNFGINPLITLELVEKWTEELIILKTFSGLKFQESILKKISSLKGVDYRLATPSEESKGIDGFIGEIGVSVKPTSYKSKNLMESIELDMIFYDKKKDGISVEFYF
jgi:hypothetical protein